MTEQLAALKKVIANITVVTSETEILSCIESMRNVSRPTIVSFVNAHALNLTWKDPALAATLQESDFLFRDGSGMKILMNRLSLDPGLNANGTDFIPKISNAFTADETNNRLALFGTTRPHLEKACNRLAAQGSRIVASGDGFQADSYYLDKIAASKPALVILGMGMPRQEQVSQLLRNQLTHPCVIINGGAILDFWAEKVQRAPIIFRKTGMEWLFRLLQEPRRLASRYLLGNIVFLLRIPRLARFMKTEQHPD